MSDMPIESPNKYGRMDDDADEFASLLTGNTPPKRTPGGAAVSPPADDDEIDAATLLARINSLGESKYGR